MLALFRDALSKGNPEGIFREDGDFLTIEIKLPPNKRWSINSVQELIEYYADEISKEGSDE